MNISQSSNEHLPTNRQLEQIPAFDEAARKSQDEEAQGESIETDPKRFRSSTGIPISHFETWMDASRQCNGSLEEFVACLFTIASDFALAFHSSWKDR